MVCRDLARSCHIYTSANGKVSPCANTCAQLVKQINELLEKRMF